MAVAESVRRLALVLLGLAVAWTAGPAHSALVRMTTTDGPIDLVVDEAGAPSTAAHFLAQVGAGQYDASFIHRLLPGVAMSAGAWRYPPLVALPQVPPVVGESSPARPNLRGAVAMEKADAAGNSARQAFFVNLGDNRATFDHSVFAQVTPPSMTTVDRIAALPRVLAGPEFDSLPLRRLPAPAPIEPEDLVRILSARILGTTQLQASDRIFNFLEAAYPQFIAPANPPTLKDLGYVYRFYPRTNAYIGTRDGNVYYLVPVLGNEIRLLGTVTEWLAAARQAGY